MKTAYEQSGGGGFSVRGIQVFLSPLPFSHPSFSLRLLPPPELLILQIICYLCNLLYHPKPWVYIYRTTTTSAILQPSHITQTACQMTHKNPRVVQIKRSPHLCDICVGWNENYCTRFVDLQHIYLARSKYHLGPHNTWLLHSHQSAIGLVEIICSKDASPCWPEGF